MAWQPHIKTYMSWNTIQSSNGLRLLSQGLSFYGVSQVQVTIFNLWVGAMQVTVRFPQIWSSLGLPRVFHKVKEPSLSWSWQYVCLRYIQSSFHSFEILQMSKDMGGWFWTRHPNSQKREFLNSRCLVFPNMTLTDWITHIERSLFEKQRRNSEKIPWKLHFCCGSVWIQAAGNALTLWVEFFRAWSTVSL